MDVIAVGAVAQLAGGQVKGQVLQAATLTIQRPTLRTPPQQGSSASKPMSIDVNRCQSSISCEFHVNFRLESLENL